MGVREREREFFSTAKKSPFFFFFFTFSKILSHLYNNYQQWSTTFFPYKHLNFIISPRHLIPTTVVKSWARAKKKRGGKMGNAKKK